jgi:hypothetical protein
MASTKVDATQVNTTQAAVLMYEIGVRAGELASSCSGGTNECYALELATSSPSRLHDEVLIEATRQINVILKEAAECRKDQQLMVCDVGGQVMLLWGTNGLPTGFKPVNDVMEIRRLLGVKEVKNAESWSGSPETTDGPQY